MLHLVLRSNLIITLMLVNRYSYHTQVSVTGRLSHLEKSTVCGVTLVKQYSCQYHMYVLSVLLSRWTKNKEWCFLCKWRQHAWWNSLFENFELSFRLKSDSQSTGKDHVYCVGFYTISYIWEHIWSRHTWPAQKETTSCTKVYVQDWHWIGYIFNSSFVESHIGTLIPPGVSLMCSRYPTKLRWWLIHVGMPLWYVVCHATNLDPSQDEKMLHEQ